MVFLFIAFLVIIFLFCAPIKVGLCGFYNDNYNNATFRIKISFFEKYFSKLKKKKYKSSEHNKKNKQIKIKVNPYQIFLFLKKIIIKRISIDLVVPSETNAVVYYPIYGLILSFQSLFAELGREDKIYLDIARSDELYFQGDIEVKINFYMIFSSVFQIIKLKIGGKG